MPSPNLLNLPAYVVPWLQIAVTVLCAVAAALFTAKVSTDRWQGNRTKVSIVGSVLAVLTTVASILLYGFGMRNVQAIFLFCIFLYVSYGDIKTHEMDNFVHVIILAVALIAKPASQIPSALVSAAGTVALMLVVAVLVKGAGIGGADIWFCAAGAFLMTGFIDCLFALGFGTFAALLCNSPFRKKKEGAGEGFPMLPYLSCSYMIVYLLSNTAA